MPAAHWCWEVCIQLCQLFGDYVHRCDPLFPATPRLRSPLALTLLVARIGADHHDPPMPTDHPALVTDGLDARVHLHGWSILFLLVGGWFGLLLLVSVHDAAPGQVVGRQLHHHPVLGQDADVVLPHLAADVGEYLVSVLQLNAEHRIGQGLDHAALDLDGTVLLGHTSQRSSSLVSYPSAPIPAQHSYRLET